MRQGLLVLLVVVGFTVCFVGYFFAIADWIENFNTGIFAANRAKALLETGAISVYIYAGFNFAKKKLAF